MRARTTAGTVVAAMLTVLGLAGCAPQLPDGVDQKLTDDWAKVAEVKGYLPESGMCMGSTPKDNGRYTDQVVDCAQPHYAEAVHVGEFKGLTGEPAPKDTAAALTECDVEAAKYLGKAWTSGRLELTLTVPTGPAWDGGARWFRCDVTEVNTIFDQQDWEQRVGSLKGAVPAALTVGCLRAVEKKDRIDSMPEISCTKSHTSEYVGSYRAALTVAYPSSDRQWDVIHKRCQEMAASFLGVSKSSASRIGVISSPGSSESWNAGDRVVRCSLWFNGKAMAKSAKGSKGKGVPGW